MSESGPLYCQLGLLFKPQHLFGTRLGCFPGDARSSVSHLSSFEALFQQDRIMSSRKSQFTLFAIALHLMKKHQGILCNKKAIEIHGCCPVP